MIKTTLIPETTTVKINVPAHYIGKKVHAFFYTEEEITINNELVTSDDSTNSFDTAIADERVQKYAHQNGKGEGRKMEVSPLVESLTGVITHHENTGDDYYQFLTKKYS